MSYDHGLEGSIAEDCFFSMVAMKHGFTFDFIEGEMHEKSPFTMWDFLQQRKRWLQVKLEIAKNRLQLELISGYSPDSALPSNRPVAQTLAGPVALRMGNYAGYDSAGL